MLPIAPGVSLLGRREGNKRMRKNDQTNPNQAGASATAYGGIGATHNPDDDGTKKGQVIARNAPTSAPTSVLDAPSIAG